MPVGCSVGLPAVEEPGLVAVDGQVKRLELGNIFPVNVLKVGVDGAGIRQFLAWVLQRGLGEGVVDGSEVKMDGLPNQDFGEIWRVEFENRTILKTHRDSRYGGSCGGGGGIRVRPWYISCIVHGEVLVPRVLNELIHFVTWI